MKKLLFIVNVLIFTSLISFSQSLSLSNDEGPISNNQVVWVNGDMDLPLAALIYVTNNTGNDIEVKVKKTELQLVPGSSNYFCWALCYPSNVYVSPDPLIISANSTNSTNFSGDYDAAGNMGISKIRYTFFKNNFPADSASAEVWFNAGYVGLGETLPYGISFSSAFPNPVADVVKFSYVNPNSCAMPLYFKISNSLGALIYEQVLHEKQGFLQIPSANLTPGVYFYSAIANREVLFTRKFIVQ